MNHSFHKRFTTLEPESRSDGIMEFVSVVEYLPNMAKTIFFPTKCMYLCLSLEHPVLSHTTRSVGDSRIEPIIGFPAHTRSEKLSPRRKPLKGPATWQQRKATTSTGRLGITRLPTLGESYHAVLYSNFEGCPPVLLVALELKGCEYVHKLVQNFNFKSPLVLNFVLFFFPNL